MNGFYRIGLTVAAMTIATPTLAQSLTTLDGTYQGLSFQLTTPIASLGRQACLPVKNPIPGALTITGGTARLPYTKALGTQVTFQGSVAAGEATIMRNEAGDLIMLRVDSQGGATGTLTYGNGCSYSFIWHK